MTAAHSETETFGLIDVASDRYLRAQAQRSLSNFKIGWDKQPATIVRALGAVKQAATRANMKLGKLERTRREVIVKASQEVVECKPNNHFALVIWQTRPCTQFKIHAN